MMDAHPRIRIFKMAPILHVQRCTLVLGSTPLSPPSSPAPCFVSFLPSPPLLSLFRFVNTRSTYSCRRLGVAPLFVYSDTRSSRLLCFEILPWPIASVFFQSLLDHTPVFPLSIFFDSTFILRIPLILNPPLYIRTSSQDSSRSCL